MNEFSGLLGLHQFMAMPVKAKAKHTAVILYAPLFAGLLIGALVGGREHRLRGALLGGALGVVGSAVWLGQDTVGDPFIVFKNPEDSIRRIPMLYLETARAFLDPSWVGEYQTGWLPSPGYPRA